MSWQTGIYGGQQVRLGCGQTRVCAAQVAVYQAYMDLYEYPAVFTVLNADSMEIYIELIPFDAALTQKMSDRAVKIITATRSKELLPRGFAMADHFK